MMGNVLRTSWEIGKILLVAFVLVVGLRVFIFQPFLVRGASMEPNFHDLDYLIVDEISYRFRPPERGEVVVFQPPNNGSEPYIKRIIGLPGETIQVEQGRVIIFRNGEKAELFEREYLAAPSVPGSSPVTLGEEEYFVMGDNRPQSSDSRAWGVLPRENIIGRAFLRVFPVTRFMKMEPPSY